MLLGAWTRQGDSALRLLHDQKHRAPLQVSSVFSKNKKALELYCDEPAFGGETRAYYKYCAMLAKKFANRFMKLSAASPAV